MLIRKIFKKDTIPDTESSKKQKDLVLDDLKLDRNKLVLKLEEERTRFKQREDEILHDIMGACKEKFSTLAYEKYCIKASKTKDILSFEAFKAVNANKIEAREALFNRFVNWPK